MARSSRRLHDLRSSCGGIPTKYLIRCEVCGHQAIIGVVVTKGRIPPFYCSWCNERDPVIERVDAKRNFQAIGH